MGSGSLPQVTTDLQSYWDEQAPTFDDSADHGLHDPAVRSAWQDLLLPQLPAPPAQAVDLGCGTGTLSLLLAEAGLQVRGLDFSPAMVQQAKTKAQAAGHRIDFTVGDAAYPPYAPGSVDVVLARHVLWVFDNPSEVLQRWTALLKPTGRLVLVEGRWGGTHGIGAEDCRDLVMEHREQAEVHLLKDPIYWGRPITDQRYLLVSSS